MPPYNSIVDSKIFLLRPVSLMRFVGRWQNPHVSCRLESFRQTELPGDLAAIPDIFASEKDELSGF